VIPKHLHVTDFKLNVFYLLVAVVDKLRVTKLFRCIAEVANFGVQVPNLTVNSVQLGQGIISTTLVFIEISLLKVLSVVFEIFFEFTDLVVVFLSFSLDEWGDFLVNVFRKLL